LGASSPHAGGSARGESPLGPSTVRLTSLQPATPAGISTLALGDGPHAHRHRRSDGKLGESDRGGVCADGTVADGDMASTIVPAKKPQGTRRDDSSVGTAPPTPSPRSAASHSARPAIACYHGAHPFFAPPAAEEIFSARVAAQLQPRLSTAWAPCHAVASCADQALHVVPLAGGEEHIVPFAAVRRCALHPAAHMCVVGVERRDGGSTVYLDLRCAADLEAVVDRVQRGIVAAQGPAAFAGSVAAVCPPRRSVDGAAAVPVVAAGRQGAAIDARRAIAEMMGNTEDNAPHRSSATTE
jgi:hypothetical protein